MYKYEKSNNNNEDINHANDFLDVEYQENRAATSDYSLIMSAEIAAPKEFGEFVNIIIFKILSKVSGLSTDFYENLTKITQRKSSAYQKLNDIHLLLYFSRSEYGDKNNSDIGIFINNYYDLVDLGLKLQTSQVGKGLNAHFLNFINKFDTVLGSDFVRQNMSSTLIVETQTLIRQIQSISTVIHDISADEPDMQRILQRIRDTELLPDSTLRMLQTFEVILVLYQRHPLTGENKKTWWDWFISILEDNNTAYLLNDYLSTELRSVLLNCIKTLPEEPKSYSAWLVWLRERGQDFWQSNQWQALKYQLLSADSKINNLLQMAELTCKLSEQHPLPEKQEILRWLLDILLDKNTHRLLSPFLPDELLETLNTSAPILGLLQKYPVESSLQQQLSWVNNEYQHPSPGLQQLLSKLPVDSFFSQLKNKLSQDVINPRILDALLVLVNPDISLKQKSGQLFHQLTGFINLEQAIKLGIRQFAPGGGLMVDVWDWYWSLPPNLDWTGVFTRLTEHLKTGWQVEAELAESLIAGTWTQVGEKAFNLALKCEPKVRWIYLRYMELSILWAGQEFIRATGTESRKVAKQSLSGLIGSYFRLQGISLPITFSQMISELEVLLSLQVKISALPKEDGWLPWTMGLLGVLGEHPQAESLRSRLENAMRDTVGEVIGQEMTDSALEIIQLSGEQIKAHNLPENILSLFSSQLIPGIQPLAPIEDKEPSTTNQTTQRSHWLTNTIRTGMLRNVGLGLVTWYILSHLNGAEAAPTNNTNQPSGDETEIDGQSYILFPSEYDSENDWQNLWERLSTLSLSITALSAVTTVGMVSYRYFTSQQITKKEDELAGSAETSLINNNSARETGTSKQESKKVSTVREYMPEIIALLTLLIGGGGYLYSKEKGKRHEENKYNLLIDDFDFNPFIKVTPELLERYNKGNTQFKYIVNEEEIELLEGNRENPIHRSRNKREVGQASTASDKYIATYLEELVAGMDLSDELLSDKDKEEFNKAKIENGMYVDYIGKDKHVVHLLIINNYPFFLSKLSEDFKSGELIVPGGNIKVFVNKENKWTTHRYAKVIKDGGELINDLFSWDKLSLEMKNILNVEVEFILRHKSHIEFDEFKSLLLDALSLVFVRTSENTTLSLELLKLIVELKRKHDGYNEVNKALLTLTEKEKSIPDLYFTLFDNRVSDMVAYKHAFIKLSSKRDVIDSTGKLIDENINLLNRTISGAKERVKDLHSQYRRQLESYNKYKDSVDYKGDLIFDNDLELSRVVKKRRKYIFATSSSDKAQENLKFRIRTLNKLKSDFNKECNKARPLSDIYFQGICMAEKLAYDTSLNFKSYNEKLFQIISESSSDLQDSNMKEKFSAAKYHINYIYQTGLILNDLLSVVPENIEEVTLDYFKESVEGKSEKLKITTNYDYRDVLLAEEAAWHYCDETKLNINNEGIKNLYYLEGLDYKSIASAVFFYKIRKKIANKEIKKKRLKDIIEFYLEEKRNENVLSDFNRFDLDGYYTISDLKKRIEFTKRLDYTEQFNTYLDKYMPYDVENIIINQVKRKRISYYTLLSPVKSLHTFSVIGEGPNLSSGYAKVFTHNTDVISLELSNDQWVVLIFIDSKANFYYARSKEEADSFLTLFIDPDKHFGSKTIYYNPPAKGIPPRFNSKGEVYPHDNTSDKELSYYIVQWQRFDYESDKYPVFNKSGQLLKTKNYKTAFEYIRDFLSENISTVVNNMKVEFDTSGTWHNIATMLIPFYSVVYNVVTDRKYKLTVGDVTSIVLDVLAIVGSLASLGAKVMSITEEAIIDLAKKYQVLYRNGLNRNAIFSALLSDFPEFAIKNIAPATLSAIRKELINFFNPTSLDIENSIYGLYKFTSRKMKSSINNIKGDIINLPTKINKLWSVKDNELINKIKKYGVLKNDVYTLKSDGDGLLNHFLLKDNDLYPAIPGENFNRLYLTNSSYSHKSSMYHAVQRSGGLWSTIIKNNDEVISFNNKGQITKIPVVAHTCALFRELSNRSPISHSIPETGYYKLADSFVVVPIRNKILPEGIAALSKVTLQKAIDKMQKKSSDLLKLAEENVLTQSHDTLSLIKGNNKLIRGLNKSTTDLQFALIKAGPQWENNADAIYGLIDLTFNKDTLMLSLDNIYLHPYCIAAQDKYLLNIIQSTDIERYKLENIATYLGAEAISKSLGYIKNAYKSLKINSIYTFSNNPIIKNIFSSFDDMNVENMDPFDIIREKSQMMVEDLNVMMKDKKLSEVDIDLLFLSADPTKKDFPEKSISDNKGLKHYDEIKLLTQKDLEWNLSSQDIGQLNRTWQSEVKPEDLTAAGSQDEFKGIYVRKQDVAGSSLQSDYYIIQDNTTYEVLWQEEKNQWCLINPVNRDKTLFFQSSIKMMDNEKWGLDNDEPTSVATTSHIKRAVQFLKNKISPSVSLESYNNLKSLISIPEINKIRRESKKQHQNTLKRYYGKGKFDFHNGSEVFFPIKQDNTDLSRVITYIKDAFNNSQKIINLSHDNLVDSRINSVRRTYLEDYFKKALNTSDPTIIEQVIERMILISERIVKISNYTKEHNYSNVNISWGKEAVVNPEFNAVAFVYSNDKEELISINGDMVNNIMKKHHDNVPYMGFVITHEQSHLAVDTEDLLYLPTKKDSMLNAERIYELTDYALKNKNLGEQGLNNMISRIKKGDKSIGKFFPNEDTRNFYKIAQSDPMLRASVMLSNADHIAAYLFDIAYERTPNAVGSRFDNYNNGGQPEGQQRKRRELQTDDEGTFNFAIFLVSMLIKEVV